MKIKSLYFNVLMFAAVLIGSFAAGILILESIKNVSMQPVVAQEEDEGEEDSTPPNISSINIKNITASSSAITWETDEEADSLVNYGLDKNYGVVRDPRADKTEHKIVLDELSPETTYYFRITSSDDDGNQGISSDYSFTTKEGQKTVKEQVEQLKKMLEKMVGKVKEEGKGPDEEDLGALGDLLEKLRKLSEQEKEGDIQTGKQQGEKEGGQGDKQYMSMEEVKEMIKKVSGEKTLEEIQDQVQKQAQQKIEPPTIMLDYADVEVGTDYAVISWETDKKSNSMVSLAHEDDYVPEANNPYVWSEGQPSELVDYHVVEVNGLEPATTYHFQVSSESKLGLTGKSRDKTFKTKAISPEIYNAQVVKVQEEQATIRWSTNVPCSSIVEYTNLNTNETKLEGNSSFLTVHSMTLSDLVFDTYYSAVIHVESEQGEETKSQPTTFITVKDEEPPVISKVNTESTLYPGSENKIQTIASWSTDEPSQCQLFYHQGLTVADEPKHLEKETDLTKEHVQVVTNFLPATVYKFWIDCEDEAGNKASSEDYTMLTPSQEESIIDIILKNFESSFGWLKNMRG